MPGIILEPIVLNDSWDGRLSSRWFELGSFLSVPWRFLPASEDRIALNFWIGFLFGVCTISFGSPAGASGRFTLTRPFGKVGFHFQLNIDEEPALVRSEAWVHNQTLFPDAQVVVNEVFCCPISLL